MGASLPAVVVAIGTRGDDGALPPAGRSRCFEEAASTGRPFIHRLGGFRGTVSQDRESPPFLGEPAPPFASAGWVVLPVPYEASVSYGPGTAAGPGAILRASTQVELYDEELGLEPVRAGIWTDPPLELSPGGGEEPLHKLTERVAELMDAGKRVILLGGEHAITPAAVRAASARHPELRVVQLDAHADLRDSYRGDRWSHACAMARTLEVAPVTAVGVRSYSAEEADRIRRGIPGYRMVHAREMGSGGWTETALTGLTGKPVYLTVDVDYFDPALVPSTGTPEPGGGRWWPTLAFLSELHRRADVVAADVVELAPVRGLHHADFTVARLVHKLIGFGCRRGRLDT